MKMTSPNARRTDTRPPDTHALAADLGVDAAVLEEFTHHHPRPTSAIVIGWAATRGELRVHPERLRDDVEAWLAAREPAGRGSHGFDAALPSSGGVDE